MRRLAVAVAVIAVAITVAGCTETPSGPLPDAPTPVTTDDVEALLGSGSPSVVNVWASWCIPCRSEAPIVAAASLAHPDVAFIGLNVRDAPADASSFIREFLGTASMTHVADRSGGIPRDLGGTGGVPLTFFYDAAGDLVHLHFGVIDEPTMATYLDEIDR